MHCEEQKNLFLHNLTQNIQTQFPSVTNEEAQLLLARHSSTYNNGFVNSFQTKLHQSWSVVHEKVPEKVQDILRIDMRKEGHEKRQDLQEYQDAIKIPKEYANPVTLHKMLFPKKNTLLALQVINRLAREFEIRFEDVETVLKECLVV